jgi:hypothetical protein
MALRLSISSAPLREIHLVQLSFTQRRGALLEAERENN